MAEITLHADAGRPTGSRSARRLRHTGRIPAVLYGEGVTVASLSVDGRELRHALSGDAGTNVLLRLELEGKAYAAMARELQRHPVRGTVIHVDFQVVDPNQPVNAEVSIVMVGDPVVLHRLDGMLEQSLFALPLKAKPSDIPHSIEVDVSELSIGDHIRVSDLSLPAGVEVDIDPETTVVVGQAPRAAEVAAEGVEGAEEGAAAESADSGSAAGSTASES